MLRNLLLASASLALVAQTPAAPRPASAKPVDPPPATAVAQPAAPKQDRVLATVGSEQVRESDFDLFLALSMPEAQRRQMMIMPGAREQYLKRFLDFKVLAAKARKEGLGEGPKFEQKMKVMEMQMLIQSLFDRDGDLLKTRTQVKDEDVKAYFDKHPEKFTTPESFSARHILVSTKPTGEDNKARTEEEAQARIKEIQAALSAGKSFDELAKQYSEDPGSKDRGGLYENMPFGRFVPEFDKAVRDQKPGEVGAPVKTTFGYHLIKVEKVTPAVPQTFEAAKEAARQQASTERQETVMNDYMEAARKEARFHEVGPDEVVPAEVEPGKDAPAKPEASKAHPKSRKKGSK